MTRAIFTGARIFDGTASLPQADVAVEDGRIVEVGPGLAGDERVDVTGRTLLPGLFDCHVHVLFEPTTLDLVKELEQPFSYAFYVAARNLRATLEAGITTVRDAGYADLGVRQAVEDGLVSGPRLRIAVNMISQTGGHGDGWMVSGYDLSTLTYPGFPSGRVDSPDEMRRVVRMLVRAGADHLKVFTSGGVLSPRDDPRHGHFSDAELAVLVEEADRAGLHVMAHAQGAPGIKAAIRAGIRSIEHGIYLDDEAIAMMLDRGTWFVPTLVAPRGVLDAVDAGARLPEAVVRKATEVVDIHRAAFRRAVEAGVRIAMGTDSGVTVHGANLRELELMREGGMAPEAVLVAATQSAADLMGLGDELGSLTAGKRADLVVVDGDPFAFDDLKGRIRAVYQDGRLVVGAP
ncbi:MAG TPA: amidohydrolase family protein [Candidatus Dormibacteraeota bacterium]|nr:amidohydrolase family protein [Candidatus Dormibacteraeota bacterium]